MIQQGRNIMKLTFIFSLIAGLLASAAAYTQTMHANTGDAPRPKYLSKFDRQFRAADKDGDGALTREEAENAGLRHIVEGFDRIDADKNGKVTRDEIRAMIRGRLSS